ncbi:MAG: hypothetical protein KGI50_07625, partial [Patescibacteria group bacterium]|nr:hypothetical protein [Patescibacteria group bacterium]
MTVSTTNIQNSYTGNGVQTAFSFTYQILTDQSGNPLTSTVTVYVNGTLQTSGYSVAANSNQQVSPGGTVTFAVAPANGAIVLLLRSTPAVQSLTFPLEAKLSTPALENALDKAILILQEKGQTFPAAVAGALLGFSASLVLQTIAPVAAGYVLMDNGPGAAPSFQPATAVSTGGNMVGPTPAVNTAGSILLWNGTDGRTVKSGLAPVQAGYVVTDQGSGNNPVYAPAPFSVQGVRLYCVSGNPDDSADHTAVVTLYVGPYRGGTVIINGVTYALTEKSLTVPNTLTQMYDVFLPVSAGIVGNPVAVAWTNDTTRATALTLNANGYYERASDHALWVGSFRTGSVAGQTIDSKASRLVSSAYNQLTVPLYATQTGVGSWSYSTLTWRSANANTTPGQGRVEFIQAVKSQSVKARYYCASGTSTAGDGLNTGIALDGTTTPNVAATNASPASLPTSAVSEYLDSPAV